MRLVTRQLVDRHILRKICKETHQHVEMLVTSIPASLNPWTQAPVTFEDALGRVAPVHLEFIESWEVCFVYEHVYTR